MECNRVEAERAKKLAEENMGGGDFVRAHKYVILAQRLFPKLENIDQMLAICDVHCSANKKIDGLDKWYGILQVQPLDNNTTIKKQYHRLALLLHPDKNKFSGAEDAFKLVGNALDIMSDESKRREYEVIYNRHCATTNNVDGSDVKEAETSATKSNHAPEKKHAAKKKRVSREKPFFIIEIKNEHSHHAQATIDKQFADVHIPDDKTLFKIRNVATNGTLNVYAIKSGNTRFSRGWRQIRQEIKPFSKLVFTLIEPGKLDLVVSSVSPNREI